MSLYINEVTVAGNLTRDPEVKSLLSGMQVVNFSVATNLKWKDKDGKEQENVEYHNIVGFGKTAETIAKYFTKGKPIYIRGRLQTQNWEKDNVKHYRTEIIIDNFKFIPDGKNTEQKPAADTNVMPDYPMGVNPEDIPF